MLKCLVEGKLQTSFLIIKDNEEVISQDLFMAFLTKTDCDTTVKRINLICYENPPSYYLPRNKITNEKITIYNYFSDPCGWNDPSVPKTDLSLFTSDPKSFKETAFFIDSLSLLSHYHGFCSVYKNLSILKKYCKKLICVVHQNLFAPEQIEAFSFLATAFITFQDFSVKNRCEEKVIKITYKKPGGKIINQQEVFLIDNQFNVTSTTKQYKTVILSNVKENVESLTTFKLGLHISERERKARDDLILPFLKTQNPKPEVHNQSGDILYQPESNELDDDPDDDLDI